ncbi:MAG TPA: urease accessory protein UreD [bacterium]|nr:urease accessory protein UreD [bacterium]
MNTSRSRAALRLVRPAPPEAAERAVPAAGGAAGEGRLEFARLGAKTVVRRAYARAPLKWIATRRHSGAAWVSAGSLGGGLVGGDHLRLEVETGEGALGFVTTQASTKVYRSGEPARQTLTARVRPGGVLAWVPDPVVCFEGADYGQVQDFHLDPGAGLILLDALTSGRHVWGERWKFRGYSSRTRILRGGGPVFYDHLELSPREGPVGERLGRFNLLAFVVLVGAPLARAVETLRGETPPPLGQRPRLLQSRGRLGEDGLVWRVAAVDPEEGMGWAKRKLGFLEGLLGDDPWARKSNG